MLFSFQWSQGAASWVLPACPWDAEGLQKPPSFLRALLLLSGLSFARWWGPPHPDSLIYLYTSAQILPPLSGQADWEGAVTLREYPLPCRKGPSWTLPKARETGDNQHLSTRLLGILFSALGRRDLSCQLPQKPSQPLLPPHSGHQGKGRRDSRLASQGKAEPGLTKSGRGR